MKTLIKAPRSRTSSPASLAARLVSRLVSRQAAGACLIVASAILAACGDGGSRIDAAATAPAPASGAPAPVAATPAPVAAPGSNEVPATAGDSPAAFFAFVKSMTASGDETSEPLSLPALKDAGDDGAEPQVVGA